MAPLVFHRCIDPCETDLAQGWGEDTGFDVQTLFPKEGTYPADADGLVINLNYLGLTPGGRAELARGLNRTLLPYPAAVCGYDLEPETAAALQAKGVLVARRLERDLFERLARAIDDYKGGDAAA
jgi:hypothetical protein